MHKKLIFIYPNLSSFVEKDIAIFNNQYRVCCFQFLPRKKWLTPWTFLKELFFLLQQLPSASVVVVQFAGYHSLIPVILSGAFHKPSAIIMGGTDCVSFPSIGYGNLRKPLLKWFTLKSFRWASFLIPASQSLVEYEYTFQDSDFQTQGYKYFDPGNVTPFEVVHNGISTDVFSPVEGITRNKFSFLTICTNLDRRNYLLKGIDLFIEAAREFPGYHFILVGKMSPGCHINIPDNVVHLQSVPHTKLPELMSGHGFYCQLSLSEGFGVALAEAMACGCVPIVSKVGIMDQIVGDSGFVLQKHDTVLLKHIIQEAVRADIDLLSRKARNQIVASYSEKERSEHLLRIIRIIQEQLVSGIFHHKEFRHPES